MIDYAENFKDPRWQKKRLDVFSRDNWTCQSCWDKEATLNVHHRYYEKGALPWEYPSTTLITLCDACHEVESGNLREAIKDLADTLKKTGFISRDIESLRSVIESTSDTEDQNNAVNIIQKLSRD